MKYESAREELRYPLAYRPILQVEDSEAYSSNLQIRSTGDAASLAPEVRQAIAEVDDKLPISGITTLREQLTGRLDQEKLMAELVSFFGLLALLLACIGLYGVMAHGVVRRTKEIGIRMALGAERRSIIWMVLRETLVLILIGIAIGVPAATWRRSPNRESTLRSRRRRSVNADRSYISSHRCRRPGGSGAGPQSFASRSVNCASI